MENKKHKILVYSILSFILFLSFVQVEAYNFEFVNVTSRVNVTASAPEITAMYVEDPVILSAGTTKQVTCNATIRHWVGFNDINNVNGTFYYYTNATDPDHNDVHYTNTSCVEINNDGQYFANYSCSFYAQYYADNGTWTCAISANSSLGFTGNDTINTTVSPIYALNVTDVIDYGDLGIGDTSSDVLANVTNFGNTEINVSVLGYGATEGDGVGLVCSVGSNISIEHQKFSNTTEIYDDKTALNETNQDVGITLTSPSQATVPVIKSTYWQLFVPPNPYGVCTGTVRFTATTS